MSRVKDLTHSYNTSYSLVAPVKSCREQIGGNDVVVFANEEALPHRVISELQRRFKQSGSGDLRPIMRDVVQAYKDKAVPLSCTILGKA